MSRPILSRFLYYGSAAVVFFRVIFRLNRVDILEFCFLAIVAGLWHFFSWNLIQRIGHALHQFFDAFTGRRRNRVKLQSLFLAERLQFFQPRALAGPIQRWTSDPGFMW